jgi:predicted signal transduction protein with EAL and GGDEF domain
VLDHALRQMGAWRARGLDIGVAVNLSARTLIERELRDHIEAMCHRWAVPTNRVVLEITESMVVADPARALPVLARLHELGVEISVDDFGTGFSSMDYLKRLPVREVGIDRSFVTTMATDARDAAIVRCTIDLARSLGLRVVAEGVESPDVRPSDRDGLRSRAGLLVLAGAAPGRLRRLADCARALRAGAQRVAAASAAGRSATGTIAAPSAMPVERGPATTILS